MSQKSMNNTAISSVFGELKYRVFYVGLVLMSLIVLVYLNLGLYIEFQGSYYLSYYQFIDFNWCQGVQDLNESLTDKTLSENLDKIAVKNSTQNIVNENSSNFQVANQQRDKHRVDNNTLYDSQNFNFFLGSVVNNSTAIEIHEFQPFFIEIVSYFSGQCFLINFSGNNRFINNIFYIYFVCLFYQLTIFFIYHCFCFMCPALLKQTRLKYIWLLLIILITLLIHFLILPYTIVIDQELRIESLDSELFFSAALNLLDSWIKCFYILLTGCFFFLGFLLFVN